MRSKKYWYKDGGVVVDYTLLADGPCSTDKYIFPNRLLPSVTQLGKAFENLFIMEDWQNFGSDYDKTLIAWYDNFDKNWDKIKNSYSYQIFRMREYFLLSAAGSFKSRRRNQLWLIVLSKSGIPGSYQLIR